MTHQMSGVIFPSPPNPNPIPTADPNSGFCFVVVEDLYVFVVVNVLLVLSIITT